MKKLIISFTLVLLLLALIPVHATETPKATSSTAIHNTESAEINAIIARVNEINAMDKSKLSSAERKALRKELRSAKKEMKRHSGGAVYVSGGFLLLIIVLIIVF